MDWLQHETLNSALGLKLLDFCHQFVWVDSLTRPFFHLPHRERGLSLLFKASSLVGASKWSQSMCPHMSTLERKRWFEVSLYYSSMDLLMKKKLARDPFSQNVQPLSYTSLAAAVVNITSELWFYVS